MDKEAFERGTSVYLTDRVVQCYRNDYQTESAHFIHMKNV